MDKVGLEIVKSIVIKQEGLYQQIKWHLQNNTSKKSELYVYFYCGTYGLPLDGQDVVTTVNITGIYKDSLFQKFNSSTKNNKEFESLPLSEFLIKLREIISLNKKLV